MTLMTFSLMPELTESVKWRMESHKTKEDSLFILKKFIEQKNLAIEYEGKAIGSRASNYTTKSYFPNFRIKRAALWVLCFQRLLNRGLMTEAVKAVIRYLLKLKS